MIKKGSLIIYKGDISDIPRVRKVSRITKDGKRICTGYPLNGSMWNSIDSFRIATPEEVKASWTVAS